MTLQAFFRRLASLLYVPTCVGCLEKIDEGVLCDACKLRYGKELQTLCITCAKPYSFCSCATDTLVTAGIRKHYKRFRYDPAERDSVANRLVYELKHHLNYDLVKFLAAEMVKILPEFNQDAVITYMPRGRAARLRYGFDQSALLAREISKSTGIPVFTLIRNRKGKEQKNLTKDERMKNAEASYAFCGKREEIKGKIVILLDDISTTGATLAVGARLLRKNGARNVVALTLAETYRQTQ